MIRFLDIKIKRSCNRRFLLICMCHNSMYYKATAAVRWKPTHSVPEMSPRSQLTQRLLQTAVLQYVTLCDFVDRHQHFRIIMLLPSSEHLKSLFRLAFLAHAKEYSPSPHHLTRRRKLIHLPKHGFLFRRTKRRSKKAIHT
jgi:hypothetical protein